MSDPPSQAKPSTPQNTLDSYISSSKSPITPQIVATSAEIRDRGSAFVANIFNATSQAEAKSHAQYVKNILHGHKKASHEITAWRCMIVKPGFTGLGGPEEFELAQGHLDDGERWAGDRVLKVMQSLAVIDAVVVVSRWYGGTLLGPSRFNHIETCTAEVCRAFKRTEELRESITTLETLDTLLESLREEQRALQSTISGAGAGFGDSEAPSSQRGLHFSRNVREETRLGRMPLNGSKIPSITCATRRIIDKSDDWVPGVLMVYPLIELKPTPLQSPRESNARY